MAARLQRLLRRAALPALVLGLVASGAHAGSFQIKPMLVESPPGSSVATYTLRNTGRQPLHLQVSAYRWSQQDNRDHLAAARRLLIIPEIASIPPGGEQLVRVALRGPRPADELAYRLHFNEIPPPPSKRFFGVRTALNMDLPLFFQPRKVEDVYRVELRHTHSPDSVAVVVRNDGTRYLRMAQLVVRSRSGRLLGKLGGPLYVLPGATRQWSVKLSRPARSGQYRLKISGNTGSREYRPTLP